MGAQNSLIQYGGNLMIFIATGSTATKMPCAFSTSAKLDIAMKTRDTSNKDDGNFGSKSYGRINWSMSSDALASYVTTGNTLSVEDLWSRMLAHTLVTVAFGGISGSTAPYTLSASVKYFSGEAYITSLNLTAGDNDTATYTVQIEGSGALAIT
jgi:hypothetical protein